MYAKAPIRGTAERESGPSYKTPLCVHFNARMLPKTTQSGESGLYKRPRASQGGGYPRLGGYSGVSPAWVPSRGPLGGIPWGDRSFPKQISGVSSRVGPGEPGAAARWLTTPGAVPPTPPRCGPSALRFEGVCPGPWEFPGARDGETCDPSYATLSPSLL